MKPLTLCEINGAIDSDAAAESAMTRATSGTDGIITRIETDSRNVMPGDLFVAIKGERFDGHDFLDDAVARGASACLVDRYHVAPGPAVTLQVENTVTALGRLSAWYRNNVLNGGPRVVGITGSNGKTTTKMMLHHVLSRSLMGRCAPKSFNNEIGVPLTLLSSAPSDDYLIVEIGPNAPGEIDHLSRMVEPDVAVITSIGSAHLEGLGDLQGIAREKCGLLANTRPEGFAWVNSDEAVVLPELKRFGGRHLHTFGRRDGADVRISPPCWDGSGWSFTVVGAGFDDAAGHIALPGKHHAHNAVAAAGCATVFGIPAAEGLRRLATFRAVDGRCAVETIGDKTFVNDAYNANPSSMTGAIESLAQMPHAPRCVVLGDMLELGAETHERHCDLLRSVTDSKIDVAFLTGRAMRRAWATVTGVALSESDDEGRAQIAGTDMRFLADLDALREAVDRDLPAGSFVWIKGSRLMRLELLLEGLRDAAGRQDESIAATTVPK